MALITHQTLNPNGTVTVRIVDIETGELKAKYVRKQEVTVRAVAQ